MSEWTCQVCKGPAGIVAGGDRLEVDCRRCGRYTLTGSASAFLEARGLNPRERANACGWLREHQGVRLHEKDVERLLTIPTPSVGERAYNLLAELERRTRSPGAAVDINYNDDQQEAHWLGIAWADNRAELEYYFRDYLESDGYVKVSPETHLPVVYITVLPAGFAHLEEERRSNASSQIGFCAMWFGDIDYLWHNAIDPAIEGAGYEPKRIDKHEHNNRIDDEMIAMIRRSKFVVADASEHRQNVYFEAGFALGLGLPVIWTCREEDRKAMHFDTRQYPALVWEENKLADLRERLRFRIESTLGRGSYIRPAM